MIGITKYRFLEGKTMKNNWYKKANEFLGVDGTMSPQDINTTRNFKANGLSPDGSQTLPGMITDIRKQSPEDDSVGGIRVDRCGGEPGGSGCGREFADEQDCKWKGYPVTIEDEQYESYQCNHCKHEMKAFDIQYSKKPQKTRKDRRRKQKSRRLSNRLTLRSYRFAATPGFSSPGGGYNNPANQMQGRLDLTEDERMIPWSRYDDSTENEYDERKQKNNKDFKLIKIKGKNGKDKYIKVRKENTRGDGVSPANTFNEKGRRKKDPRYNPKDKPHGGNPGAWPHNRDDNEGSYNMYVDKNRMNSDMRERVIPWSQYILEKGHNGRGMMKPY